MFLDVPGLLLCAVLGALGGSMELTLRPGRGFSRSMRRSER